MGPGCCVYFEKWDVTSRVESTVKFLIRFKVVHFHIMCATCGTGWVTFLFQKIIFCFAFTLELVFLLSL